MSKTQPLNTFEYRPRAHVRTLSLRLHSLLTSPFPTLLQQIPTQGNVPLAHDRDRDRETQRDREEEEEEKEEEEKVADNVKQRRQKVG